MDLSGAGSKPICIIGVTTAHAFWLLFITHTTEFEHHYDETI